MEDNVSWPLHSNDCFCIWKTPFEPYMHYWGKSHQIWCYIMVSFLNHIASILSERGLKCGATYYPLSYFTILWHHLVILKTVWVSTERKCLLHSNSNGKIYERYISTKPNIQNDPHTFQLFYLSRTWYETYCKRTEELRNWIS